MSVLPSWLDPQILLEGAGSWATAVCALILFAECGLLIGFFLPGDTLLFMAGLLIASEALDANLWVFIGVLWVGAFVGNMVGFWIGWKVGPAVFRREDAKLLKPEYIAKSQQFFDRYGKITIVLARFVPIIRTVATVMAGASKMNVRVYTLYSALGGLLWVAGVTIAGYFLGQIPLVRDNVDLIFLGAVIVVVVFTVLPAVATMVQRRRKNRATPEES